MSANVETMDNVVVGADVDKHPIGLYALFGTEMWERFSFYSMLALFTLYLRDPAEGFGWTATQATTLYANYLFFVYFSPWLGGLIADRITGYRKAVMIGGFFFMAGHGLLSIPALWAVYAALTCLVIGNGFFKPNVSTMVGNLYPEGSHLKDRAYIIFYMGINVGAMMAPIVMEFMRQTFGFHAAFAVAAFGMVISVAILWFFKSKVEDPDALAARQKHNAANRKSNTAATSVDAPPRGISDQESDETAAPAAQRHAIDEVPNWKRVVALLVIFAIVIVFWMVFHQNGSTLTYWADDNTEWNFTGVISNSINPFFIIVLSFPLVWFWKWLDNRGREPSTPTKMAFGMLLTGVSFIVLYLGALTGESGQATPQQLAAGSFRVNERVVSSLKADGVPEDTLQKILTSKEPAPLAPPREPGVWNWIVSFFEAKPEAKNIVNGVKFSTDEKGTGEQKLTEALGKILPAEQVTQHKAAIMQRSYLFRVSPFWLILAYAIISLGELMLSPMGLSLVSKVAPLHLRGLMMGGWFMATAIGNKLTQIGVFWDIWRQSSFFIVLALMAVFMAIVLAILLKPLKKAMPGI